MNCERMAKGIRAFLEGLAEGHEEPLPADTDRTPERVAASWAEDLASGYDVETEGIIEPIPAGEARGPVVIQDVEFTSVCAHHLLPFQGTVSVAYLPGDSLAGFGHVGRLVDALARRLQIQERLTAQIANNLERALRPRGIVVVLEGEHLCLALRGPRKRGHRIVTQEARGLYEKDAELRREAMRLLTRRDSD